MITLRLLIIPLNSGELGMRALKIHVFLATYIPTLANDAMPAARISIAISINFKLRRRK
jgi:hypothetical protein